MEVSQAILVIIKIINDYHLLVGSPWGAGTFADADGSRKPTKRELDIAQLQGETFYDVVSRVLPSKKEPEHK